MSFIKMKNKIQFLIRFYFNTLTNSLKQILKNYGGKFHKLCSSLFILHTFFQSYFVVQKTNCNCRQKKTCPIWTSFFSVQKSCTIWISFLHTKKNCTVCILKCTNYEFCPPALQLQLQFFCIFFSRK